MKKLALQVAILSGLTGIAASASAAEDSLNVVSWGGAYTASQTKAYHEPWTEKTGQKIVNIDKSQNALSGLRAQVESGNVTWDLVDILPSDAIVACDEALLSH